MDWCYSSEYELSALDGINEQTQNLERAVLRENEINKNLQDVLQKMVAEIKATEDQSSIYREDIKVTLNRQRIVENSVQSTNDSCLLVEKLRCDLKKQVTLEQIRTKEQEERLQKIVTKYEKLWNGYETVYNLFPMVRERNNLQLHIKKLEIIVLQQRKLLEAEEAKKNKLETIRGRIMQLKIVQFIKLIIQQSALHEKYSTLKEKINKTQDEIDRKRKDLMEVESKVPCEKEKTVLVKQVQAVQNSNLPRVTAAPTVQLSNVTSCVDQKMKIKVPEYAKPRELTKSLLFSPLEMTHIELPQLKLPVFNSPPRKVQRTSRPLVRPVRLFPEYSFLEKEPCTEVTTLECSRNEVIPMEVNSNTNELVVTSEITTFEDRMEVEETQHMEQVTGTFSRTPEQTQSQHHLEQQQQKQNIGQQGEEEQSHVMYQEHELRQEEHSLMLQDLQTSDHQQQQQQQQYFWQQQEHQQDETDPQQCQHEATTEHATDMQSDEEPVVDMRSSSQPLSDTSDTCDIHPPSHDESFDSTSERARREFISKVTKSPEFTFIPRRDVNIEEVDKGDDDMQIDTRSQYFLNPLQSCSEQRTITVQPRQQESAKQQNVEPQVTDPEFPGSTESLSESREHTGRGVSPREKEITMAGSDDLLALSFHSLSPPDGGVGVPLSPPSSQAPERAGNQGFMFSFAPQSTGSIMSLFDEAEPNQEQEECSTQQKKNEAFTFTFDKKTKSSSFFKLF